MKRNFLHSKANLSGLLMVLLLGGLATQNQSCVHDPILPPEPPLDTVFNNDTFLSYWYFPKGSWWVYKRTDTTADVYDTATVTRTYEDITPRSRVVDKLYQSLILDIAHTSKYVKRPIVSTSGYIISLSTNGTNVLSSDAGGGGLI